MTVAGSPLSCLARMRLWPGFWICARMLLASLGFLSHAFVAKLGTACIVSVVFDAASQPHGSNASCYCLKGR